MTREKSCFILLPTFWEVFASTNIAVLFIVYGLSNLCRWYHCFKEKNLPVNVCVNGANCHLYRWCLMTNILLFSTGPLECEHLLHLPVGARFEPIFVQKHFCSTTPVSSCEKVKIKIQKIFSFVCFICA